MENSVLQIPTTHNCNGDIDSTEYIKHFVFTALHELDAKHILRIIVHGGVGPSLNN